MLAGHRLQQAGEDGSLGIAQSTVSPTTSSFHFRQTENWSTIALVIVLVYRLYRFGITPPEYQTCL